MLLWVLLRVVLKVKAFSGRSEPITDSSPSSVIIVVVQVQVVQVSEAIAYDQLLRMSSELEMEP